MSKRDNRPCEITKWSYATSSIRGQETGTVCTRNAQGRAWPNQSDLYRRGNRRVVIDKLNGTANEDVEIEKKKLIETKPTARKANETHRNNTKLKMKKSEKRSPWNSLWSSGPSNDFTVSESSDTRPGRTVYEQCSNRSVAEGQSYLPGVTDSKSVFLIIPGPPNLYYQVFT